MADTFMQALARQEGFYVSGSRAARNFNPGNIDYGKFAQAHGGVLETIPAGYNEQPRFAAWPDADSGFAAMRALLTSAYIGLTVADAVSKWAPGIENDTGGYIAAVCQFTGMQPTDVLTAQSIG
jgi:hypothetical protein